MGKIVAILYVVSFIAAVGSILASMRYFGGLINGVKEKHKVKAILLGPLIFLFPALFAEEVNQYRAKFAISLIFVFLSIATVYWCSNYVESMELQKGVVNDSLVEGSE